MYMYVYTCIYWGMRELQSAKFEICIYIFMYAYLHTHVYQYIKRERTRDRKREKERERCVYRQETSYMYPHNICPRVNVGPNQFSPLKQACLF